MEGRGGRWEVRAPLPGGARQEIGVACLRGEVVIVGGFDDDGITARVDAYDPAQDTWRALAPVPEPLHHANVGVVDDTLVVAGFLVSSGFDARGTVYRYDADADAWSNGAAMPADEIRGASAAAALDGALVVVGGLRNGSVADASRYDVASDSWTELPALPEALDHLGAAVVDGALHVVGGRANGLRNHTTSLWRLRDDASGWDARAPMPRSRAGFAAAAYDGALFVVGGEGADVAGGVFDAAEAYDPAADAWRTILPMRTPRHGMGACSVDGALYVPGGADVQGFAGVDVHERFIAD